MESRRRGRLTLGVHAVDRWAEEGRVEGRADRACTPQLLEINQAGRVEVLNLRAEGRGGREGAWGTRLEAAALQKQLVR